MKRMVGSDLQRLLPDRYYNHDANGPIFEVKIGETRHRAALPESALAESDLIIMPISTSSPWTGINQSRLALRLRIPTSAPRSANHSRFDSYMDPASGNTRLRLGQLVDEQLNVFH